MPQVRAIDRDCLAIRQHANRVPVDLRISEARPSVVLALFEKLFKRATLGRRKEQLATDRVEVLDDALVPDVGQPGLARCQKVPAMLGIVAIEATDFIRCFEIASIA